MPVVASAIPAVLGALGTAGGAAASAAPAIASGLGGALSTVGSGLLSGAQAAGSGLLSGAQAIPELVSGLLPGGGGAAESAAGAVPAAAAQGGAATIDPALAAAQAAAIPMTEGASVGAPLGFSPLGPGASIPTTPIAGTAPASPFFNPGALATAPGPGLFDQLQQGANVLGAGVNLGTGIGDLMNQLRQQNLSSPVPRLQPPPLITSLPPLSPEQLAFLRSFSIQ